MVIAPADEFNLRMPGFDRLPYRLSLPQIKRRASDIQDAASRNQFLIQLQHTGALDGQHVIQNITLAVAAQVKIRMVRQIDERRFV